MKETELAKPVISWLIDQHWEVYQEVQFHYGDSVADIVAVRNDILWIIESKMTYGLKVLEQATRWASHYRSVAVPWARTQRDYRVAQYYFQVGVIEVHDNYVNEVVHPPLYVRKNRQIERYKESLTELHKTFAPAGSPNGQHLTPYKQTMMEIKKVVAANPGCTIKYLYDQLGAMHYSSAASFKGNLVKSLVDFEKDWCNVDMETKPYRLFVKEASDVRNV